MNILAKFEELVPSNLPFVEGKLEGHKQRKNYSIVGPGVAEDSKQFVKIPVPHGYNFGAVSAMPNNGSGLHSHTTAEVFLIYSGKWKFYWGADGKNHTFLDQGDIISMPTNMFRGFENVGDEEGLIFVVLGQNDPGIITWVPNVLKRAKETGMALLDDNSLIDLSLNKIPEGRELLKPISDEEVKKFDNYSFNEIQPYIYKNKKNENEIDLNDDFKIIQIIGQEFQRQKYSPIIDQKTGFNLSLLKSRNGELKDLLFSKPTILFCQKGSCSISVKNTEYILNSKDTISIPIENKINIKVNIKEECLLNCISQI